MAHDFPYLYRGSYKDAAQYGEEEKYDASFRENVSCSRAIEQAIRDFWNESDGSVKEGCARQVLEQYGFKRVNYVLANSLQEMGCAYLISDEVHAWGRKTYVPTDGRNRYFAVDTAAALLDAFIGQARAEYQALGLFDSEHCINDQGGLDYTGKVLVISPDTLREECWNARAQLWVGEGGFGCSPTASGRAVYATCLGDGEQTRWDRSDFLGVLDEQYLPDWAREKLEELQAQKQAGSPAMGGMS